MLTDSGCIVAGFRFSTLEILRVGITLSAMDSSTSNLAAAELKAMQDSIHREKILRARRQTPEERLADVFELTNSVFARMHDGAMRQADTTNAEEGWQIVRKRLARLRKMHDAGRFVDEPPAQ